MLGDHAHLHPLDHEKTSEGGPRDELEAWRLLRRFVGKQHQAQ